MEQQQSVIIAGMHRSGTSMVARIASLLGVYFGPARDLMTATEDNPEGYFENRGMWRLHDALLARLGGAWDRPPLLRWADIAEEPAARALAQDARVLLHYLAAGSAAAGGHWGWKDPRSSLVMDFWKTLVSPATTRLVLCVRNPKEVVASLSKRGDEVEHPYLVWRAYYRALMVDTAEFETLWLHYDSFFENTEAMVERLTDFLGLDASAEQKRLAAGSVNPALKRRRSDIAELWADDEAPATVKNLYAELLEKCWRPASAGAPGAAENAGAFSEAEALRARIARLESKCDDLSARAAMAGERANFFCQLFWSEDGAFSEEAAARQPFSAATFLSEFEFHTGPGARHLRLDVANRPGQFEIETLEIADASGARKIAFGPGGRDWSGWQAKGDCEPLAAEGTLVVLAFGDDPQLRFAVPPELGAGPFRVRLRVRHEGTQTAHFRRWIKELKKARG